MATLLGEDLDSKLTVLFNLVIQADDKSSGEALAEEELNYCIALLALNDLAELN